MSRISLDRRLRVAEGEGRAAEDAVGGIERRPWFRLLARGGLTARGVVYLVLAYLSLDLALHGGSPAAASGEGALAEVVRQPAGPALLVVLTVGLAAYGLWRLVQAVAGRENPRRPRGRTVRAGWVAIAAIYAALCAHAAGLLSGTRQAGGGAGAGSSGGAGGSQSAEPLAARVLRWPAGQELLGAAGVALLIGGASLAAWGAFHDYERELRLERLPRRFRPAVRVLGALGDAARGFVVGLVGVYLLDAALDESPSKAKTTDLALRSLAHTSYGPGLLGAVAAGLLCFALYSFCEAVLRDL